MIPDLSLILICRNAEKTIRKCLESIVKPTVPRIGGPAIDEIVIVDTGSTDHTRRVVDEFIVAQRAMGGRFISESMDWPKHFGEARQAAFQLATNDWRGWIDADDVLEGAEYLKPTLEAGLADDHSCVELPYIYATTEDGRVVSRFLRERFVKWSVGWHWEGSIHEHLVRTDRLPYKAARVADRIQVRHQLTLKEILTHAERNLSLTLPEEAPHPAEMQRMLYFMAMAAKGEDPEKAKGLLTKALGLPVQDVLTQVLARYYLAEILTMEKKYDEARALALQIISADAQLRLGYQALANTYVCEGRPDDAAQWYVRAFDIPKREEYLGLDDSDDALLALSALEGSRLPDKQKQFVKILSEYRHLEANRYVQRSLARMRTDTVAIGALEYAQYLVDHDEFEKASTVLRVLPYSLVRNESLANLRRYVDEYLAAHGRLKVDPHWQPLPENISDLIQDEKSPWIYERARWAVQRIRELGWKRVLSIGCCDGLVEGYIAKQLSGVEIVGIDRNVEALAHAAKVWTGIPNLRFSKYPEGSWDGQLVFEVVEHLRDEFDVGAYGAPMLITTPASQPDSGAPHDKPDMGEAGHLRIYTGPQLRRALKPERMERIQESLCELWTVETGIEEPYVSSRNLAVFICAGSPFPWGPETKDTRGLTGSEECMVYLAEALAKNPTIDVVVAVQPLEGKERIINGVHWVGLDYLAECDLDEVHYRSFHLVVWRQPALIKQPIVASLKPKTKTLWLHDATYGPIPPEVWADYTSIICATQYHKKIISEQYPSTEGRIRIIGHGIPHIEPSPNKNPYKAVYASSPDRGLKRLLRWWPEVKKAIPKLELHVFYGRGNMRAMSEYRPGLLKEIAEVEALMEYVKHLDVHDRGLVPHHVLHEELATAGLWLYPTTFEEIACLTAYKAQAAGAFPIFSPGGCLDEVITWGTQFVPRVDIVEHGVAHEMFLHAVGEAVEHQYWDSWQRAHITSPSWPDKAKEWEDLWK